MIYGFIMIEKDFVYNKILNVRMQFGTKVIQRKGEGYNDN